MTRKKVYCNGTAAATVCYNVDIKCLLLEWNERKFQMCGRWIAWKNQLVLIVLDMRIKII